MGVATTLGKVRAVSPPSVARTTWQWLPRGGARAAACWSGGWSAWKGSSRSATRPSAVGRADGAGRTALMEGQRAGGNENKNNNIISVNEK